MKFRYFAPILVGLTTIIVFASHSSKNHVETSESVPAQESSGGPVRTVRFTVFDEGIRPSELRIKAGFLNILFEDRTNVAQAFTIYRVTGAQRFAAGVVQKSLNQSRGRNSFRLTEGQYEFVDQSRPMNRALITVEP